MTHVEKIESKSTFENIKDEKETLFIQQRNDYGLNDTIIFQHEREEFVAVVSEMILEIKGLKSGYVAFVVKPKE
jgi:hypothetical protein